MDGVRLALALLLPWAVGTFCLRAFNRAGGAGPLHPAVLAGFGLFIGLQVLYGLMLLSDAVLNRVSFAAVAAALAAFGVLTAWLALRRRPGAAGTQHAPTAPGREPYGALFWIFAGAAVLHLLFCLVELLHLPVFPWDAWGSWMYRAKAWFHAGQILPMASPQEWRTGSELAYNVMASDYPGFLPAVAMWCALALGEWSETLVNLPSLACGIALALGTYGLCRSTGAARGVAALGAYALLSLPLVGTHLSLAGYADIWMAAYAGLGLAALISGFAGADRRQFLLGLAMLLLATTVKREGGIWLLAGLLTLALAALPRRTLAVAFIVAAVALAILAALGMAPLALPWFGRVGIDGTTLYLPFLGALELQYQNLWESYLNNFFSGRSWHLLWPAIVLAALALPAVPRGRTRRAAGCFFLVALALPLLVLQVTDQGRWVASGTIVNRMPLQIAPALIVTLLLLAREFTRRRAVPIGMRPDWRVLAGSVALTALVLTLSVFLSADRGTGASRSFAAADMQVVVGEGELRDGALAVTGFSDGIAVLSSGQLEADTGDYELIHLQSSGNSTRQLTVFWRDASDPAEIRSVNVENAGDHWIDVAALEDWRGRIMELGVVAYEEADSEVRFAALTLSSRTPAAQWARLRADWSRPTLWTQRSVNAVNAGSPSRVLTLPLLAACWLLCAALLALLLRKNPGAPRAALLVLALGWILLDGRWLANRWIQSAQTVHSYPLLSATHLAFGDDDRTLSLVEAARASIEKPGRSTVIFSESVDMDFARLRAKYFALPAAAFASNKARPGNALARADFLLVLRQYPAPPGYAPQPPSHWAEVVARQGRRARVVWEKPDGVLLELSGSEDAP